MFELCLSGHFCGCTPNDIQALRSLVSRSFCVLRVNSVLRSNGEVVNCRVPSVLVTWSDDVASGRFVFCEINGLSAWDAAIQKLKAIGFEDDWGMDPFNGFPPSLLVNSEDGQKEE